MNLLEKAFDNLVPSKPIFTITAEPRYGQEQNSLQLECQSQPQKGNNDTPIERLVHEHFHENWDQDTKRFVVNTKDMLGVCKRKIQHDIIDMLRRHMKQKHPMETKMGMFYRDKLFTKLYPPLDDAVYSTWNFWVDKQDVTNTLKLLEFLFTKYKHEFPDEPNRNKRRRRRR